MVSVDGLYPASEMAGISRVLTLRDLLSSKALTYHTHLPLRFLMREADRQYAFPGAPQTSACGSPGYV